ncbi:MAG TPA: hypothetical protein VFC47_09930, partial [Caulobacteraceae bacterium]|nr:hypothetical protein [Caulobacteraceae bacterium]
MVFTSGATGTLELAHSTGYTTGKIQGLSTTGANALDLADITFTSGVTKATFSGSATSGVLTVTDGTHTAGINLIGDYLGAKFATVSDGHGGTLIADNPPPAHWAHEASGVFATAANWTGGAVPGPVNDAILDAAGSTAYTVTSAASQSVASIQTASTATLNITGGVFTASNGTGAGANAGTILAAGGGVTIEGAVANTGHLAVNGGSITVMGAVTGSGYGEVVKGTLDFAGAFNENVVFTSGSTG